MIPSIIGIAGSGFGCGKDTVGQMLAPFGYRRKAFADVLKNEVAEFTLGRVSPTLLPDHFYSVANAKIFTDVVAAIIHREDPSAKPTSPRMRRILQHWGTELRRAQDKDYWVKRAEISVGDCFTDVRFPNEVSAIKNAGGAMIWVYNPRIDTVNAHASENSVSEQDCDITVVNDGTLEQLRESVEAAIWRLRLSAYSEAA